MRKEVIPRGLTKAGHMYELRMENQRGDISNNPLDSSGNIKNSSDSQTRSEFRENIGQRKKMTGQYL